MVHPHRRSARLRRRGMRINLRQCLESIKMTERGCDRGLMHESAHLSALERYQTLGRQNVYIFSGMGESASGCRHSRDRGRQSRFNFVSGFRGARLN